MSTAAVLVRSDTRSSLSVEGARRLAASVALVAASFVQAPGTVAADTKIDLYVDPWGFLGRALHLWDPSTASGSLQNQAFGYLFPQGPFYGVLESLGVPAWVAQRLWWALILVVAFNGMVVLLRAFGVGNPTTRIIGALAFALSPRIVSALGQVSSEIWPMAMAPWVLAPLVRQSREGGDPRRSAARAAAAFFFVGAINAVASVAVLILPVIWLATRRRSRAALRLAAWWVLGVGLVSLWWFVAILLLGRYSPPFLSWIETAAVTTAPASDANALRGATAWLGYLAGGRGPTWPAGWTLVTQSVAILDTGILAALGIAGLAWRGLRDRAFLVTGAVVGVVLLSLAWDGAASSPLSAVVRSFLDGAGSPLRNVHKFDPVLRVVLVIGLVHLMTIARPRRLRQAPWVTHVVPMVAVFALLGAAVPVLTVQIASGPNFTSVPDYWRQTADWLNTRAGGERTLVVPGSQPTSYLWGGTGDDILQPLLREPWAERDGVPLGSAGNTRFLDAVEQVLGTGRGSAGLPSYLSRSGVTYVVARNDLDWARLGTTPPTLVHAALQSSGLTLVTTFGPSIGASTSPDVVIDSGLGVDLPAVEVWAVPNALAVVTRSRSPLVVAGGPEDLLRLSEAGLSPGQATILAGDAPQSRVDVVTDGYRRREVNFGNSRANSSATMTADEPFVAPRPVHDYWPFPPAGNQSVADYAGGTPSASTSGAAAGAVRNRSNGFGASQAFDGDTGTAWRSASLDAVGQWVALDGFAARPVGRLRVFTDTTAGLARVRTIDVSAGDRDVHAAVDAGGVATVDLGDVSATSVRITITEVAPGQGQLSVGLRDVQGLSSARTVTSSRPISGDAQLRVAVPLDRRPGCVTILTQSVCSGPLAVPGEEDLTLARTITVDSRMSGALSMTAVARGGDAVDALLLPIGPSIHARATSTWVDEPADRAQAAVDRDQSTAWIASPTDTAPSLLLSWPSEVTVRGLELVTADAAVSPATSVQLIFDGARAVTVDVGTDGKVAFPAERATTVEISPVTQHRRASVDPRNGLTTVLPWGLSEVVVVGADAYRRAVDPSEATGVACGFGPSLKVDGRSVPTRVEGRLGDLLTGRPVRVVACGVSQLALEPGGHVVQLTASSAFRPDTMSVAPSEQLAVSGSDLTSPRVLDWGRVSREIDVGASVNDTLLVVHENASAGWTATVDGARLADARVDGWQQAWVLPAGVSGTVRLEFAPDRYYRLGLGAGLVCVLLVLLVAMRRPRPRSRQAALQGVVVPRGLAVIAPVAVGALLGGAVGAAIGVAAAGPLRWFSRDRGSLPAIVAGGAAAGAAVVAAARPWPQSGYGGGSLAAQLLALTAVCVLVAVPRPSSGRSAHEPAEMQGRTLDDVPGDSRRDQGEGQLDRQDPPEVS